MLALFSFIVRGLSTNLECMLSATLTCSRLRARLFGKCSVNHARSAWFTEHFPILARLRRVRDEIVYCGACTKRMPHNTHSTLCAAVPRERRGGEDSASVRRLARLDGLMLAFDPLEQIMEGIGELLHALILQLLRDLIVMNADLLQLVKRGAGAIQIIFDTVAYSAVIAEVLDGLQRHCVHGIRADQFLGIEHVAVCRVLGAGAGPERALHSCAGVLERFEARRAEDAFELLVDQAGVGDGRFPLQGFELLLLGGIAAGLDLFVQQFVNQGIDAADKEAGDGGY